MRKPTDDETRPHTYHNIECLRLCGGQCTCKMATTFTPPRHFTPIDGINYSFGLDQTAVWEVITPDGQFVQVFDETNDLIDEYPLELGLENHDDNGQGDQNE